MRESRTYGSGRGACHEMHVPTATTARVHHAARRRGGAWPLAARAQQPERVRRIGVLMAFACRRCARPRLASRRSCRDCSNWAGPTAATCGSTCRWAHRRCRSKSPSTRPNWSRSRRTSSWPPLRSPMAALQQATRTVPDRVRDGCRPGRRRLRREPGAAGRQRHGFIQFEFSVGGKWLELLQADRPGRRRAWRSFAIPPSRLGIGQFAALQAVAPSLGVEVSPVNVRDADEIERGIAAFARSPNGGLIVTGGAGRRRSSRADRRAGRAAPAARDLSVPLLCRRAAA